MVEFHAFFGDFENFSGNRQIDLLYVNVNIFRAPRSHREVAGFYPDDRFFVDKGVMLAHMGASHPGARRVTPVFVAELA
jgi:hypothetical protein|tara:strand:- start:756 stop:992 length:237 start_codon:yes stop_codon:yes gene_type:complete